MYSVGVSMWGALFSDNPNLRGVWVCGVCVCVCLCVSGGVWCVCVCVGVWNVNTYVCVQ